MPTYLLEKNAFVGNVFHKAGAVVTYDGVPAPFMTPLKAASAALTTEDGAEGSVSTKDKTDREQRS